LKIISLLVAALLMWPAVVSAGGWYLLVPHLIEDRPGHESAEAGALPGALSWKYSRDLRRWNQAAAFDSAGACEQEKQRMSTVIDTAASNARARAAQWTPEQARLGGAGRLAVRDEVIAASTDAEAWRMALCVSTDDARLQVPSPR